MIDWKKLYLELNMWLIKNMGKFVLWIVIFTITMDGIYYYRMGHQLSSIAYNIIMFFSAYAEWKIIFR